MVSPREENIRLVDNFGKMIVRDIVSNLRRKGNSASGKTEKSITFKASEFRLEVFAASYLMTLEDGRGPTKSGGGGEKRGELRKRIKEWIIAKSITPEDGISIDSLAFLIARKIHKEGTKLFRQGGRSGVVRNAITAQRILALSAAVSEQEALHVETEFIKELTELN